MGYNKELEFCETLFQEQNFSSKWIEEKQLQDIISRIGKNFDSDIRHLRDNAGFIKYTNQTVASHTTKTIELFREWAIGGNCPSLAALCQYAIDVFGISSQTLKNTLYVASLLGEVEHSLAYHNNMHFRKVVFQCMRMIAVYNDIYNGTSRAFNETQITLLLATACVHDFGHDGKGNTLRGVYIPHRLEENAYQLVAPVFEAAGFDDKENLNLMHVMLLCTDVTPFNDPGNAVNQAKAAYRHHFLSGTRGMSQRLNLDEELKVLEDCPAAAAMALMLHEADIATSAGLHYDITKYETSLLRSEISDGEALPQHVLDFLKDICNRQMLSEVGQQLYAANMARIYALAEDDVKNGNKPFPEIARSDFILGIHSKDYVQGSKSMN